MKQILVGVLIMGVLAIVAACGGVNELKQQQELSVAQRVDTMARAEAAIPVPYTQNFPLRQVLADYTRRGDMINHPWYTYIMSDTGAITHYFVSTTIPVSTNAFLGSTEKIYDDGDGNLLLTAPSLDGIYYGGGGSITSSNGWIFIDAATGAMGVAYGQKILTFDAPLLLETEPQLIRVSK